MNEVNDVEQCLIEIKEIKDNLHMRNTMFDLAYLAQNAGVRVKDGYRSWTTPVRLPVLRQAMRIILRRADTANLAKAEEYVSHCGRKKVQEIWADEKRKCGAV